MRISGRIAVVATAVACAGSPAAAAARGPGDDAHYFQFTVASSGSYTADYGDERLQPGQTTSFGVDGFETGSWTWKMRGVGRSVGNGALKSAAVEFKGSASHEADIISYTIQMGNLGEDHLCGAPGSPPQSTYTRAPGTPLDSPPAWLHFKYTEVEFRDGGMSIDVPGIYGLVSYCFHGMPPIALYDGIEPGDADIPRGAFNPRSDRSFDRTWSDSVNEAHGDTPSKHTESASSELQVTARAISGEKARKKRDEYRKSPVGGVVSG